MLFVAVAFGWVAMRLDWRDLGQRFAGASPHYIGLMAAAWISAFALRTLRMRYVLNVVGRLRDGNFGIVWTAVVLGMAVNTFAPMRAGDVVCAIFLRQRLGVTLQQCFSAIMVDWFCDLVCVVSIFVGALSFAPGVATWTGHAETIIVSVLVIAAIGFVVVMHYRRIVVALADRVLAKILPRHRQRLVAWVEQLLSSLSMICTWRIAATLTLGSVIIWSLTAASYYFCLRAVLTTAPFAAGAFSASAIALSFVVPIGPAGLGAFEAASVLSLAVFRVPIEPAIAFAVVAHVFQLAMVLLLSSHIAITQRLDFRKLQAGIEKR